MKHYWFFPGNPIGMSTEEVSIWLSNCCILVLALKSLIVPSRLRNPYRLMRLQDRQFPLPVTAVVRRYLCLTHCLGDLLVFLLLFCMAGFHIKNKKVWHLQYIADPFMFWDDTRDKWSLSVEVPGDGQPLCSQEGMQICGCEWQPAEPQLEVVVQQWILRSF